MALSIMKPEGYIESTCISQNVSSGGVYFWADTWDDRLLRFEFVTVLPAQITLGASVMARCSAKVVRVERDRFTKVGVAATIKCWAVM